MLSITTDYAKDIGDPSSYNKCVSMEILMSRTGIEDEKEFLTKAFETGTRLSSMIAVLKSGG